jgi:hypothetical protein
VKLISNIFTWIAAYFLVWWWKRNSHYDAPEPFERVERSIDQKLEDLLSDRSIDA